MNRLNPEDFFMNQSKMNSNKVAFSMKDIDFSLSGQPAQALITSLIEVYKQNGGKNFLTMTFGDEQGKYEVTIQKSGKLTAGEKLQQLHEQNVHLISQMQQMAMEQTVLAEVILQAEKRIEELEETLEDLAEIDQQIEFLRNLKLEKYQKAFDIE